MSTLSREVLKWLQSLDLSYSVKDVKRDVSNGFLIAEIMSRYFPGEVGLYSFDNGTKLQTKNDNWEQLYKFFQKKKLPIGKLDFDPVIHCVPGAAISLVTKVYKTLTRRDVPQFPETTAKTMVKTEDQTKASPEVKQLPTQDEEPRPTRRQQMDLDLHTMAHSGREVEARQVSQHVDIAPLDIKEVQLKQVTKSVTQLRVASDLQMSQRSRAGTSASGRRSVDGPSPAALGVVKPALDLMKPIVQPVLAEYPDVVAQLDPGKDQVHGFLELCHALLVPEQVSVRVFEALAHRAPLLAESLLRSPTEYWKVWTMLKPGLHAYDEASPVFEALVFLLKRLGESMMDVDAGVLKALFLEMALPLLVDALASPGKRELLCELLAAQVPLPEHISLLRALKARLDIEVFVQCLSHLALLDGLQTAMDEYVLDLYVYYAMIACRMPQPKVRMAGLVILGAVAGPLGSPQALLPMAADLEAMAQDTWWEVQAQLITVCATLLRTPPRPEEQEAHACLLRAVHALLKPSASRNLLQVGLVHTCKLLVPYPELLQPWVRCLLAQPAALRQRLLHGPTARLALVMGPQTRLYEARQVDCPRLPVARACLEQVGQRPHLDCEHAEVLAAMAAGAAANGLDEEWQAFYTEQLMAYALVAVVDPELHAVVTELLMSIWMDPQIGQACLLASSQTLVQTLRVRYMEAERERSLVDEPSLLAFLRRLLDADAPRAAAVRAVLQTFKQEHGAEFARSQLGSLL